MDEEQVHQATVLPVREETEVRQLAEAVRQSPVVVVVTDADGNIQYANPRFFALTGYTPEEVLGKNTRLFKSGLHTMEFYKELWTTITQGLVWRGIFQNKKKNGEVYWEKASISSVCDAQGTIVSYIAVKEDITATLHQQAEMEKAKQRAERANQAKSDFLANISHEIRTPLNAINGYLHLALKTNLTNEQRDYLLRIGEASQTLLDTLNAVLDFSKIEAGRMVLESRPFRLQELLDEKAAMVRGLAATKGLSIAVFVDKQASPGFYGDSLRLGQILLNLLSNAIKFTDKGGIKMRASLLARGTRGEQLRFSVEDTGIGIAEDAREHIFEAFTQGDNSTTRRFGGTGLGLGIAERLVKLMGGAMTLQSEVGKGSEFSFALWLLPAPEVACVNNAEAAQADLSAARQASDIGMACEQSNFYVRLERLAQLLADHDGEALSLFKTLLPQFTACGEGDVEQVTALDQAIRVFDFSAAGRILTKIREGEPYVK